MTEPGAPLTQWSGMANESRSKYWLALRACALADIGTGTVSSFHSRRGITTPWPIAAQTFEA